MVISFVVIFFIVIPVLCMLDDFITKKFEEYIEEEKAQKISGFDEDKRS